ncbi:MAG: Apolipoprotein N-acyltransferase [Acidobacteria bacterium]|nr:Apolipoprotein N-acyltransferase [Acidobacteriota bacterium]
MLNPACSAKLARMRAAARHNMTDWGLALLSALLLVLAFPDFNLWILAWVGLVPLLIAIARRPLSKRAFCLSWITGSAFFYITCYWLTYSMIHYAGIPAPLAYALLLPGALLLGVFPGVFGMALARLIRTWGTGALFVAPLLWVTLEWLRLNVTGQLWNAIGYSQAFHPSLIRAASWGGVYAVGLMIVAVNAAIAFALLRRTIQGLVVAGLVIVGTVGFCVGVAAISDLLDANTASAQSPIVVVALQPNVPMEFNKSAPQMDELFNRHITQSEKGLSQAKDEKGSRLVIWPESPMNFTYGTDPQLRDRLSQFVQRNHTSLILNSQEPAANDGSYNSALLINEEGRLTAQYDKIRLMPFGEYVPLPRWLPGSDRVRAIVGGFTPGSRYTLMPVGTMSAGVFICIESAYPWIPRTLAAEGAEVLINISNDGYLGPTPVMRQHLANTIFRAVENGRPVLRVTNTGITAYIDGRGKVVDATNGFQEEVRTWTIAGRGNRKTIYTKFGDWFVGLCGVLSLLLIALSFRTRV